MWLPQTAGSPLVSWRPDPCPRIVSKFKEVNVIPSLGKGNIWSLVAVPAGSLSHPLIPPTWCHLLLPCDTWRHCNHYVILCSRWAWKAAGTDRAVHTLKACTLCKNSLSDLSTSLELLEFQGNWSQMASSLSRLLPPSQNPGQEAGAETLSLEFIQLSSSSNFIQSPHPVSTHTYPQLRKV